jgi:hypothetical protein
MGWFTVVDRVRGPYHGAWQRDLDHERLSASLRPRPIRKKQSAAGPTELVPVSRKPGVSNPSIRARVHVAVRPLVELVRRAQQPRLGPGWREHLHRRAEGQDIDAHELVTIENNLVHDCWHPTSSQADGINIKDRSAAFRSRATWC